MCVHVARTAGMKMFGPAQWLFSFKLFITAMIAYAISVRMGLPQSYWTIVTCCVVMNPATGVIRSKGLYRLVGTVADGVCFLALAAGLARERARKITHLNTSHSTA